MFHDFAHKLLVELTNEEAARQEKESGGKRDSSPPDAPPAVVGSSFMIEVDDVEITISDLSPGISLYSVLGEVPQGKQEEFFTSMLRGNFLGQATRKASLGIDESSQKVILSRNVETTGNYREFRDAIEDFTNAACFWKKQIEEAKK